MIVKVKVLKVRRSKVPSKNALVFEFDTDMGVFTTPPNSNLNDWIPPEKRFINNTFLFKIEDHTVTGIVETGE